MTARLLAAVTQAVTVSESGLPVSAEPPSRRRRVTTGPAGPAAGRPGEPPAANYSFLYTSLPDPFLSVVLSIQRLDYPGEAY